MSQCLRCSKLCEPTAVFCDECRSLLRNQLQHRPSSYASQQASSSTESNSVDSPTLPEHTGVQGDPLERITRPLPSNRVNEIPQPPALTNQADLVEQAVTRLSKAAQLIEQEEDQGKGDRKTRLYSRASRLAPIRDISADIRRESTPLPKISSTGESESTSNDDLERRVGNANSPAKPDSGPGLPDYWPWLDAETEDKESDIWANRTDPLISRHIPTSAESARIEEEDIRRAMTEGIATAAFPVASARRPSSRMRVAFISVAILALIALVVDGILLNVAFDHPHHSNNASGGIPTLTLSSNSASIGDTVTLRLAHFSKSASIVLTHDIQEPIQVNGSSSITTDSKGTATAPLVIDNTWQPGFHLIVAEDVTTRYTASATLQITGAATPPPHLLINPTPINMGADVVGANTIEPFKLANGGGGSITWSASSNQSWLLVAPSQGTFSQNQIISIAVQRVGLKPGDYNTGVITITSNVSTPQHIEVDMSVQPLPPNTGPVLALSPALLSFTTTDGDRSYYNQYLTISNPGTRTLNWSRTIIDPATATTQSSLSQSPGSTCNWLSAYPGSGAVAPGATSSIKVIVNSSCLLPGAYIGTLKFTGAGGTVDSSQSVNVSLTVQPHCGIVTSTGYMAFTAVEGQSNPGNQTLSLNATASCAGMPINWTTSSTAPWLTITPASGQLKGTTSAVVSVNVNVGSLPPKLYQGDISFVTGQSTLTVMVQLTVQAPPSPAAPIMGASPLSLNFSNTQGQPSPTGQVVTITNNGGSPLKWNASPNCLTSCWLNTLPTGGTIAIGQTGQVTINVNTSQLTPGNYVGQVTLFGKDANGKDAPGSPQTITINLVVQPPCSISPPSSSALSFSAVQGASSNPTSQTVMFTGTGSCVWPVTWHVSVTPPAGWLKLAPVAGMINGTGQSGSIGVAASTSLPVGTNTTQVTISASDNSGAVVQGSPQTFSVTLTILPPCVLSPPSPASLAFSVPQGQSAAAAQNVTLSEKGTCARPVTWTATGDTGSSTWLVLSAASGTDSGSGSTLGVNVNSTNVLPGTYTGAITIKATDSAGSGSGQTINVTLTVTGFTISGTVIACSGPAPSCPTPQALPGAAVTLMSGSNTVGTTIADASGNYSFPGIALGTYTFSVSGTDANNIHYVVGSPPPTLTLSGNALNVTIQVFPA
jgi:BACON domain-containing protein